MTVSNGDQNPTGNDPIVKPVLDEEDPKVAPEDKKLDLTQEQLNKTVASRVERAAKQAAEAHAKEIAEKLGMSLEEASELVKQHLAKQEAEKSELDKLREANEAQKKASETESLAQQQKTHVLAVKLQLSQAGLALPEDKAEATEALSRMVGLVTAPMGSDDDDIAENIEKLKTQFPALFQAPEQKQTGNPPSNPSGTPRKPSLGNKSAWEQGQELAARVNAKRGVTPTSA